MFRTFSVIVIILGISSLALARPQIPDNPLDHPEILKEFARQVGLEADGYHLKKFRANPSTPDDPDEIYKSQPDVVKHLRFNKGKTIPEPEYFDKRFEQLAKKTKPDPSIKVPANKNPFGKFSLDDLVIPRIPPCIGNKTHKVDVRKFKKKDGEPFDWLYIRSTAPKENTEKKFGKSPDVLWVQDNSSSAAAVSAGGFSVGCLPTRIRGTDTHFYRHEGLDALKNYDEAPDGEGVLDKDVEKNKGPYF